MRGGKILEFLKDNSHLDLEVPDIAFNVKKSEKTVEAALQKLQQKGLVTARRNEYGRIYWYALPSAPATKSFKPEEITSPKETSMAQSERPDDEADLGKLQKTPAASAKKNRKTITAPQTPANEEAAVLKAPAAQESGGSSVSPTATIKTLCTSADKEVRNAQSETADFKELPAAPSSPVLEMQGAAAVSAASTKNSLPMLIAFIVIVGLLSLITLMRINSMSAKVGRLETSAKSYATVDEVKAIKNETEKISILEAKIALLGAQIDSLKRVVRQTADDPLTSKQKKPFSQRHGFKKR